MLLIDGGYLLPDLQVDENFPIEELPRTAQLVVEVANTSHQRDREKIADYARAGVPEYWIVDVISEIVVVHRDPVGEAYATVTEHRDGELQPLLDAPPLALRALFGRA
jgi:Uma2 family endonuclease